MFDKEPEPETTEERVERFTPIAKVIYQVSNIRPRGVDRVTMISVLITLGQFESKFAKYVGEGRCIEGPVGMQCDPDEKGIPRARSYFQHWEVSCPKLWETEPGSKEELFVAAKCTARKLTGAYYRCREINPNVWAGAFSGFRASSCIWEPAIERANAINKIRYMLVKELTNNK